MNKIKSLAIFIILTFSLPINSLEIYEYENTKGSERYSSFFSIAPSKTGYEVNVKLAKGKVQSFVSEGYEIRLLRFIDTGENIDLEVERKGEATEVRGIFHNSPIKKTIKTDDDSPWCQFFELKFPRFITSDETRFNYWVFFGYEPSMFKMLAEKTSVEKITVNGKTEETWHVVVKPEGFYSVFWHADYWFRKTDGAYLKYEAIESFGAQPTVAVFKRHTVGNRATGLSSSPESVDSE
jgi:hypothetical protein